MTSGNEMRSATSRQAARRSDASQRVAVAARPVGTGSRWSRRRGVVGVFAAFAVVGFAAAYIGPIGMAISDAQATTVPVTLYADTIVDAQQLSAAPAAVAGAVALDRGNYTVYVTPTPTPTPTPTETPEESTSSASESTQESSSDSSSGSSDDSSDGWSVPFVAPDPGSAQAIAYEMVKARGWSDDEFSCLVALWNRESGWRVNAYNPSSGAYGIPQSLPGNKMASAGDDWETNPATQITWGLGYIAGRYGTPCGAWGHSESVGWY